MAANPRAILAVCSEQSEREKSTKAYTPIFKVLKFRGCTKAPLPPTPKEQASSYQGGTESRRKRKPNIRIIQRSRIRGKSFNEEISFLGRCGRYMSRQKDEIVKQVMSKLKKKGWRVQVRKYLSQIKTERNKRCMILEKESYFVLKCNSLKSPIYLVLSRNEEVKLETK